MCKDSIQQLLSSSSKLNVDCIKNQTCFSNSQSLHCSQKLTSYLALEFKLYILYMKLILSGKTCETVTLVSFIFPSIIFIRIIEVQIMRPLSSNPAMESKIMAPPFLIAVRKQLSCYIEIAGRERNFAQLCIAAVHVQTLICHPAQPRTPGARNNSVHFV